MKSIIHKIPEDTTFEDFKKKYAKHFPISKEKKREAEMAKDYQRLTGKDPAVSALPVKRAGRTKKENDLAADS